MSDSVRVAKIGLQTTPGTPAGTLYTVPVNDIAHKLNRVRKPTDEYFGALARQRKSLAGGQHDEITIKSDLYYAWHGQLLSGMLKLPTTIAYPGETTTIKQHTMIEAINPPLLTVQFDDGVQSWQMTDCVVNQAKFTMGDAVPPTVDFDLMGLTAQPIADIEASASLALSNFDGPASWQELLFRQGTTGHVTRVFVTAGGTGYTAPIVAFSGGGGGTGAAATATQVAGVVKYITITSEGSGYTTAPTANITDGGAGTGATATAVIGGVPLDFVSASVTMKRNRKPRFVSRRSIDPKRFTDGPFQADWDIMPDYTTDTASLFNLFRSNTAPGAFQFEWVGPNMFGTQSFPVYQINFPNPFILDGQHDVTKVPAETPIKGTAGYDPTTGASVKVVLVNDTASFVTT